MHIISFDVATKSLATSIIYYNLNITSIIENKLNDYNFKKKNILKIINRKNTEIHEKNKYMNILLLNYIQLLDIISDLYTNKITIENLDVVDLIPGKKVKETTIIERTQLLQIYLITIDKLIEKYCLDTPKIFLIEYQMGPNDKSRVISSQILYHFTKYCKNDNINKIYLVGPSLKNKIIIGGSDANYSNFLEKYSTNYTANKNHSKYNFLKLLKYLKKENIIKNIKPKNIDDIADSTLMSLAYVLTNLSF